MKKLIVPMLGLFGLLTGCSEVQTVKGSLCDHFLLLGGSRIIDAEYEGSDTQYDYYYLIKYGKYRMSKTHEESWGGPFIEERERFPFTSWDSEKYIKLTFILSSDSKKCYFIKRCGVDYRIRESYVPSQLNTHPLLTQSHCTPFSNRQTTPNPPKTSLNLHTVCNEHSQSRIKEKACNIPPY